MKVKTEINEKIAMLYEIIPFTKKKPGHIWIMTRATYKEAFCRFCKMVTTMCGKQ